MYSSSSNFHHHQHHHHHSSGSSGFGDDPFEQFFRSNAGGGGGGAADRGGGGRTSSSRRFTNNNNNNNGGGRRTTSSTRGSDDDRYDTEKLYDLLGVPNTSSCTEIKKAYHKLAILHHPDKGGDESMFQQINSAYEILSDPQRRQNYDRYGVDEHNNIERTRKQQQQQYHSHAAPNMSTTTTNTRHHHHHGHRQQQQQRHRQQQQRHRRGDDITKNITVTLEDLYNGGMKHATVTRKVVMGPVICCSNCNGIGYVIEVRPLALGIVTQIQRTCNDCDGEGYVCTRKERVRCTIEVHIDKGAKHGTKVIIPNKGDERPIIPTTELNANASCGGEPGDLIVTLHQQREHGIFQRKGNDLLFRKTVSLKEALIGYRFKIQHLDGRILVIESKPGEIIKPFSYKEDDDDTTTTTTTTNPNKPKTKMPYMKMIPNEGMPCYGNPYVHGDLYVLFNVEFPNDGDLSPEVCLALGNLLPGNNSKLDCQYDPQNEEVCHLWTTDISQYGRGGDDNNNKQVDSEDGEDIDNDIKYYYNKQRGGGGDGCTQL